MRKIKLLGKGSGRLYLAREEDINKLAKLKERYPDRQITPVHTQSGAFVGWLVKKGEPEEPFTNARQRRRKPAAAAKKD